MIRPPPPKETQTWNQNAPVAPAAPVSVLFSLFLWGAGGVLEGCWGGDTRQYAELSIAFGGGVILRLVHVNGKGKYVFVRTERRRAAGERRPGGLAGGGWGAGGGGVSSGFSARFY